MGMEDGGLQKGGLVKNWLLFSEGILPRKGDRWWGSAGQSLIPYLISTEYEWEYCEIEY